jgi:hypothetical protein
LPLVASAPVVVQQTEPCRAPVPGSLSTVDEARTTADCLSVSRHVFASRLCDRTERVAQSEKARTGGLLRLNGNTETKVAQVFFYWRARERGRIDSSAKAQLGWFLSFLVNDKAKRRSK